MLYEKAAELAMSKLKKKRKNKKETIYCQRKTYLITHITDFLI